MASSHESIGPDPDRRAFLKAAAVAPAAGLVSGALAQDAPAKPEALPRRKLGKTGVELTMLEQGGIRGPTYERILRLAFANGIRTFDSAKAYGTEGTFGKWLEQSPEVRKQIFIVTKDTPREPGEMLKQVDERLATLKTDYIDLFFVHGLGDKHSTDEAVRFVKSKEFGEVADKLKKSGKIKFIGFSSHHQDRAAMMQAAAEAGIVDAIMLQYRPWIDKDSPLNKAIDACWKKGVGLISMKQVAGNHLGDKSAGNILDDVVKRVPVLKERKLTPYQGLLHAIWTDERITSACVSMRNTDQLRENADAARRFEPLKEAQIEQLRDAMLAAGPTLCADCDGRCSRAAGTPAALGDLTRFLTYYQQHGDRAIARDEYAKLSGEARDWSGADLEAARAACPGNLDFARLLPEVDRRLA
ncbi:aldo/keto reductase [Paludisphaera borealis]|uniref:Putative oxidoreductase n=1 Tax=Paludisphaera borealis TaxID=1387353 RepID=A0A1U7CXM4_9BACT|nr:aldo/keto reductase [Paludisphaera borealis]APW63702.1 putative oxidoreductase [Paludisphaera borealis]